MRTLVTNGLFTVFAMGILLTMSCQKDLHPHVKGTGKTVTVTDARTESAKNLHASLLDLRNPENQLNPMWENAWGVQTSGGDTILVVSAPERPMTMMNPEVYSRRFVVFDFDGIQASDARIVELVGRKYDVRKHLNHLLSRMGDTYIKGFEGSIMYYDVNYNRLYNANSPFPRSHTYVNGHRDDRIVSMSRTISGADLQKMMAESQNKSTDQTVRDSIIREVVGGSPIKLDSTAN